MANTSSLNLELIESTDNIETSLIEKMNSNFEKLDRAYGEIGTRLMNATGKNSITEAIQYIDTLIDNQKTTLNISLSGTYSTNVTAYGAGINEGELTIWALTNTTGYEHISFTDTSIIGTKHRGWNITNFDTSDPSMVPHACTVTGLSGYNTLNISLNANSRSDEFDYIQLEVTISGE